MARFSFSLLPLSLLACLTAASNFDVTVGKDGQLKFVPETLNAYPGDTVTYHFFSKNHSVVQSTFDAPCQQSGFFSGFTPATASDIEAPTTFQITVNDTKPIWVFCGQTGHCQKGMVHAINAATTGDKTIDAYAAAANKSSASTTPADGLPFGGRRVLHMNVGTNAGTDLVFSPNNVTELPRTIVEFSFNEKNHSVVQSNFANPCQPLANGTGFSSGFVPTPIEPSGVLFDIVIQDAKPIWFYCAQTTKTHCQAGMVGSINALSSGPNTFDAFVALAKQAPPSTLPPQAPVGGILSVNGTLIPTDHGNVLNLTGLDTIPLSAIPQPGENISDYITSMAGGAQPASYNWAPSISDNATTFLQQVQFIDNILLELLFNGYSRLSTGGAWSGLYPPSIVSTFGTLSAQALVHRSTATDSLQHYQKPLSDACTYNLPLDNVDDFLEGALSLILLEIGLLIDAVASVASTDPWMVPALATALGAKSRMSAVINMMQGHAAAAAPREALIPAELAWSYASNRFVSSCPQSSAGNGGGDMLVPLPALNVTATTKLASSQAGVSRVSGVTVKLDSSFGAASGLQLAWIGAWGNLHFSAVADDGSSAVPDGLFGHVWLVLVTGQVASAGKIMSVAKAGPELLWISGP